MTILQKKIKSLHKKIFPSPSKIRRSESIAKKILTINKYGKYENRRKKQQLKNLFGKLMKNLNSLFYSVEKINRNFPNKVRKSVYEKDRVFYKLYNEIENRDTIFDKEDKKKTFHASFIEQKKDIDQSSALFTVSKHPLSCFMQI